jgi:nitrogen regulatory protein PII
MTLLVFICNQPDKLEEILEGFVEIGVTGATIIDSVGMGRFLSSDVPIFAGFRSMFHGATVVNKTILSVISDRAKIDAAYRIIEDVMGTLDDPGRGIFFTIPLDNVKGLKPELG